MCVNRLQHTPGWSDMRESYRKRAGRRPVHRDTEVDSLSAVATFGVPFGERLARERLYREGDPLRCLAARNTARK